MADTSYSRRQFIRTGAALGVSAPAVATWLTGCQQDSDDSGESPDPAISQERLTTITIPINESPWLPSFEAIVARYQEQTGNTVNLRRFPFDGLLTQQVNAMNQQSQDFDILNVNEVWAGQYYDNGWVVPLREIDPDFEWDPQWIEYDGTARWNADARTVSQDGEPMGVPINGNIQLFLYRKDLYDDLGLTVPETFEQAMANGQEATGAGAAELGYVTRGGAGVTFDFGPLLHGHEQTWFANPEAGDWTPTINSDGAKEAMAKFLELLRLGPSEPQTVGQAEALSLFQAGRALHGHMVSAVHAALDDPAASAVAGQMGYAVMPQVEGGVRAPHSGIWVMGIPPQIADEQKQAAYNFLRWLMEFDAQVEYAEAGGIITRQDVYESDLAEQDEFRYMQAMAESSPHIVGPIRYVFSQPMLETTERRLNEIVADDLGVDEGMETMADELQQVVADAGLA